MPDFRHALILQHLLSSPRRSLSTLGVFHNTRDLISCCCSFERELYDLFGSLFIGNDLLSRLILD